MVKSKVSLLTGVIYRLRKCFNVNCLRQLYFTQVCPHLLYCSVIMGRHLQNLHRHFITQRKLTYHVKTSKLLKLPDNKQLQTNIFVHKSLHSYDTEFGFIAMSGDVTQEISRLINTTVQDITWQTEYPIKRSENLE